MNRLIDQAARRADALPMPRIVAVMLGGSAAFFCLAMPMRVLRGFFDSLSLPEPGLIGHLLFAGLFALLAGTIGWLALTIMVRAAEAAAAVRSAPEQPNVRKRPVSKAPRAADRAPVAYRRGDAHPDAPPRRPIFAAHDLGTPFDEIVTDRKPEPSAPPATEAEEEFRIVDDEAVEFEIVAAAEPVETEEPVEAVEEVAVEPAAEDVVEEAVPVTPEIASPPEIAPEPVAEETEAPQAAIPEIEPEAQPQAESGPEPDAPSAPVGREESIAALMARFEGGLGRLSGTELPPPPDPSAVSPLKRTARSPDDALRDALEALQRMAARQR